ncbi:glycosyltransferase family 4 protein [Aestuariivirga sp.]|uniref:glycosyltransferase family 4 protein n=1 Tax=Aestuariivirga sp. TaxID=2650926 RepID=UPI003BAA7DF0
MKIIFLIPSFSAGGVAQASIYAARAVAELTGWHVTLVALHDRTTSMRIQDVRTVALGLGVDSPAAEHFLTWLLGEHADIVISSDVSVVEPAFPYFPRSACHIVHLHDSGRRYRSVVSRYAQFIDGVMCVASHMEEIIRKETSPDKFSGTIGTVYNGAAFPDVPDRVLNERELRLIFIGRVDPLKGIDDLPPLLRQLKKRGRRVHLSIVGGFDDKLFQSFKRANVESWISWHGQVPHEKCYSLCAASDILLVPSRHEAFGMGTIEAMSMGCVPIGYNFAAGHREILEHGHSGYLLPVGKLHLWTDLICYLDDRRDVLISVSRTASIRVRNNFGLEVMGRALVSFLNDAYGEFLASPHCRLPGVPSRQPVNALGISSAYRMLPASLKRRIRRAICASPSLSIYLLNR